MSSSAANSPSPAATSASASSPRRASPTPVSSSPTSPLATDDEYEIPERSSKIIKRASSRSSSTIRDEGFGDDHAPSSSSEMGCIPSSMMTGAAHPLTHDEADDLEDQK
ncbi:uncharacterized protein LOC120281621 isoform X4 [Dioscorea cayenensis subsp. rotundata]|uniref:Uncharacterized protein LOC120281621 isoform X4 n=1 Tax=Dioscorea cayennensis subsp. rotundata TaxID=55577 RepID=A0AB40D0B2_DIOCR|nr:uncharacterized protein LOC120281621 isoform X4 [Dioscorea cayenensis subsp. rotundata]